MDHFCPFLRFLTVQGVYQKVLLAMPHSQVEHRPRTLLPERFSSASAPSSKAPAVPAPRPPLRYQCIRSEQHMPERPQNPPHLPASLPQ